MAVERREDENARADIPPFLVIAGASRMGKTYLLSFLSILTGAYGQRRYLEYNTRNSRFLKEFISRYLETEHITPIFVDEIDKDYFTSKRTTGSPWGEAFVKGYVNSRTGKHPCLIATTNAQFSADRQIVRRIYYPELTKTIDDKKISEAARHQQQVLKRANDRLFKDFTYRILQYLNSGYTFDAKPQC